LDLTKVDERLSSENPVTDSLTEACKYNEAMQQNDAKVLYSESYLQALNACTAFIKNS
jgi:hypothetical protein